MARFRTRRRRFGRRGRVSGVRRARRVLKRVKRIRKRKTLRKRKRKQYFYGYSGAAHLETGPGLITVGSIDQNAASSTGLFAYNDINEILEQVKTVEDIIYPTMTFGGRPHNRLNIKAKVKGTINYILSNGNQAGAAWVEVYICKPRKGIPMSGVGPTNLLEPQDIFAANMNQQFVTDYNDARGITINAVGTGGVTNILQNATAQTKPTITTANYVVTPYMVPAFTENFKVVKQLKYVIPPGGQTMFQVKSSAIVDRNHISRGTGSGSATTDYHTYRPWYGKIVFLRFHGQPVHDATSHITVNYGSVALDAVWTKKYWYSTINGVPMPSYVAAANSAQGTIAQAHLPSLPPQTVAEDA